ncbi:hypothetical protein GCM10010289_80100 [Streptomyces violascens]|nr:hypothetical protein GCM10010289_80100 [Streptomyces violascens]
MLLPGLPHDVANRSSRPLCQVIVPSRRESKGFGRELDGDWLLVLELGPVRAVRRFIRAPVVPTQGEPYMVSETHGGANRQTGRHVRTLDELAASVLVANSN